MSEPTPEPTDSSQPTETAPLHDAASFGEPDIAAACNSDAMTVIDLLAYNLPPHPTRPRPGVKRVLQADGVNLIVFNFRPGQALPDHQAAHPITVQVLQGKVDFSCGERTTRLAPGRVVHLPGHTVHSVYCPEDSTEDVTVMLLMMHTGQVAPPA